MSPAAVAAAGLAALAAGMGIGRFAFTPILPLMQAEGTLTLADGGWLAAANYAGYLAGALSATLVPASVALRVGLAGVALCTLLMGLDAHFASWIALRAAAGVGSAWVLIHVSAWSLARLPLARPALTGTVYAGVGAGAALAGALCLAALRFQLAARDVWLALGAIALVAAVVLWPLFAERKKAAAHAAPLQWSTQSLLLVVCYAAFGFSYIIPATFIPAFARETLGDAALYGWAWPLFGAAAAASTVAVITMAGLQEARRLFGAGVLAAMTAGFAAGQIAGPAFVSVLSHAGGRPEHAWIGACAVLVAAAAVLFFRRPYP
jgi:MFS family permease